MSIFNRTSLMESVNYMDIDVAPYAGEIAPTMESVAEMSAELNEGVYKLNSSLYIADLLLEQRAMAGEDVEHLMEAAVGDFFRNMKEKFQKMWAKIKAFFASIGKKIEIFVSTGKHFISTYEGAIKSATRNKDVNWITYSERESYEGVKKFLEESKKITENILKSIKTSTPDRLQGSGQHEDRIEEDVCKLLPGSPESYSEAKEVANKIIKGKKTGVNDVLDAETVNRMLKDVKEYLGKGKTEVQNKAKTMDALCGNAIGALKKFENAAAKAKKGDDGQSVNMEKITEYCGAMSKGISFAQWVNSKSVSAYTRQYQNNIAVLKAFASKNSRIITRKESYDSLGYESDSLLENILEAF